MFTEVDTDPQAFTDRYRGDATMYKRFYIRPELDKVATKEKDRPIYKEVEYIEIRAPGNATSIIQRRATQQDRERFHREYLLFKEGMQEQQTGTPLTEVGFVSKSQAEELFFLRIRTVEALAGMPDSECAKLVGLYELKRKAGEYLERTNGSEARLSKMEQENAELKAMVEKLSASQGEVAQPKESTKTVIKG